MTDPIQPADEWRVYTAAELQSMNALDYIRQVARVTESVPIEPPDEQYVSPFKKLVQDKKADAWDEGITYAVEQTLRGKNPVNRDNPYRSES